MKLRTLILIGVLILVTGVAIIMIPSKLRAPEYGTVSFGRGQTIVAEVAMTPAQQKQGLSGRDPLTDEMGMVFVYDDELVRRFTMRGMTFPIDIIWVNRGVIVGVEENALPPSAPDAPPGNYYSPLSVDTVIEVAGGFTTRHGVVIGQPVDVMVNLDEI